jgi:hypothetical protein
MHPVAVEFDFVQPLRPIGRLVNEFGELRFDPAGERRRLGTTPSAERSRHVLVSIEEHLDHRPEPRTVYQLARTFNVPQQRLMQLAGLVVTRDAGLCLEAVRFAARSEPTQKLSPDERDALNAFITVLSRQ